MDDKWWKHRFLVFTPRRQHIQSSLLLFFLMILTFFSYREKFFCFLKMKWKKSQHFLKKKRKKEKDHEEEKEKKNIFFVSFKNWRRSFCPSWELPSSWWNRQSCCEEHDPCDAGDLQKTERETKKTAHSLVIDFYLAGNLFFLKKKRERIMKSGSKK